MDPFTIMAGLSAVKGVADLFGKKKVPQYQAPAGSPTAYTPPPAYQAPTFQSAPQYQRAQPFRSLSQGQAQESYNLSPLYQQLLAAAQQGDAGGSYLPAGYREAVLGRARRDLGEQKDIDQRAAVEDANKYNLLGSGVLAVRQGKIDDAYSRRFADVADSLTTQELAERGRVQGQLGAQEQSLLGMANQQNVLNQQMGFEDNQQANAYAQWANQQANSFGLENARMANAHALGSSAQANQMSGQNAALGYQGRMDQYSADQSRMQDAYSNLFGAAQWAYAPQMLSQYANALGSAQPSVPSAMPAPQGGNAYANLFRTMGQQPTDYVTRRP